MPDAHRRSPWATASRREFLCVATAAGAAALVVRADGTTPLPGQPRARISVRVADAMWSEPRRCRAMLAFIEEYRDVVDEVALFTSLTHPPLPLAEIRARAATLAQVIPRFKAIGVSAGINHLATIGHLDENLGDSLQEPWQRLVDYDGSVSRSCYCASDPRMREYVRDSYVALAGAGPDFLWVDDDLRLESHGPIRFACFCDRCLSQFSQRTGRAWDRESLVKAFRSGPGAERLTIRRQWLDHNRTTLRDLLAVIRSAVDGEHPDIPLGLMTGEAAYSGYGFTAWAAAMSGPRRLPVKWRPGGGFYADDVPSELLGKAHSVGRQVALLPAAIGDVQYEHENFPYQRLKKSVTTFTLEIAAAIGAGCTGAAINCLGMGYDPIDEYRPYFAGIRSRRGFYDAATATFGRSDCEGLWAAFTRDHFAAAKLDGDWFTASPWGGRLRTFDELSAIGLPPAYSREGGRVTVLDGDGCLEFTRDELLKLLAGGVIMDVPALQRLQEMGLEEHVGFVARGRKDADSIERFTADPINGRFDGWRRDCRPSFHGEPTWLLEPASPRARPLSELIDFRAVTSGPVSGVFQNDLGGRVAVFGYYPWRWLQSLAKASQLKSLARWLSRDALPAYVTSFTKASLWCRRDPHGRPAMLLMNGSADPQETVSIHVRDVARLEAVRADGRRELLEPHAADGPYHEHRVAGLGPWEPVLLRVPTAR